MARDEITDLAGVALSAFVEPPVLVAPGWCVAFGLGVTQQHQTAHWQNLDLSFGAIRGQPVAWCGGFDIRIGVPASPSLRIKSKATPEDHVYSGPFGPNVRE